MNPKNALGFPPFGFPCVGKGEGSYDRLPATYIYRDSLYPSYYIKAEGSLPRGWLGIAH